MKKKAIYKILRTEGVGIKAKSAHYISYLGKSNDGYPYFAVDYDDTYWSGCSSFEQLRSGLIVNTKPGYTLMACEVVHVPSNPFGEHDKGKQPIITSTPIGSLFYIDYVYCNKEFDERLLLMM